MSLISALVPVPDVSKAFTEEFRALTLAMSRSTAPLASNDFTSIVKCIRCDHIANDHRHDDAHECPSDPRIAARDMCPFRCTAEGCGCVDMAWAVRDLHVEYVIQDLRVQLARLTDAVVGAAALYFGQIEDSCENDARSKRLHALAVDLVKDNPRLEGAYPRRSS